MGPKPQASELTAKDRKLKSPFELERDDERVGFHFWGLEFELTSFQRLKESLSRK